MKTLGLVVAVTAMLLPLGNPANAHGGNLRAGADAKSRVVCPPGTCNPRGGARARNANLCRPANCRK